MPVKDLRWQSSRISCGGKMTRQTTHALLYSVVLLYVAVPWGCHTKVPPRLPQPRDRITLTCKNRTLTVEVVFDARSRKYGLKNRKHLEENHGMLFVFPGLQRASFWMKDTFIPLSIAFLDDDGRILQIEDMRPKDVSSTESKHNVRYALEVNKRWFQRAGIGVGDSFRDFSESVRMFRAR